MMNKKIVLVCSACYPTTVLYNYINAGYPISHVIEEKPMRGMALAKRRFKKQGFFRVSSQIAFSFLVVPVLGLTSKKRIRDLKKNYAFNDTEIPTEKITKFATVNDEDCIRLLKEINPGIVLVSGTRIISKKVLESCSAEFINMHAGITPQYRGVHGGYWAVANNDAGNFGVTIHRVDKGIDTGAVLYQERIEVSKKDNYCTYPYLQLGEGLSLMKKAVEDILNDRIKPVEVSKQDSRLWYHPTFWQYVYNRVRKKKK